MTEADFAGAQIVHRLGSLGSCEVSVTARDHAVAASSGSALAWNAGAGQPYAVNGWQGPQGRADLVQNTNPGTKPHKARDALMSLLGSGLDHDVLIDMQDRRVRALALPSGTVFPTVSFNRLPDSPGRVLWQMPGSLHQIGSGNFLGPFPDPDALAWEDRAPRLVWRGAPTGRALTSLDLRQEGLRFEGVFAQVSKGRRNMDWAAAQLAQVPRFAFVRALRDNPMADVGFVERPNLAPMSRPLINPLLSPPMPARMQARFKYIAVLRGADLASSYFWTMNSGSLALVMDSPWQSFASVHFRPWEHYVPFRVDLSDLQDRLAWCAAHPRDCAAMVRAAQTVCLLLSQPGLRAQIDRAVVDAMRAALARSQPHLHP
jgi:hypothetical protein